MNQQQRIKLSALFTLIFVISTLFTTIQAVKSTASVVTNDQAHEVLETANSGVSDHNLRPAPSLNGFDSDASDFSDYKRIEQAFIRYLIAKNSSAEETAGKRLASLSGTASEEEIVFNLDVEKSIYVPGETVSFSIQATSGLQPASSVSLQLYILKGETNKFWRFLYYGESPESLGLEIVPYIDRYVTTNQEGFYYGSFTPQDTDKYVIIVKNPYNWYADYRYITVSPIAAFWRMPVFFIPYQRLDSYAMILNASDFTPLEGAEVTLTLQSFNYDYILSETIDVFSGQTGTNGLCQINITGPPLVGNFLTATLTATYNGLTTSISKTLWSYFWSHELLQKYEFIITTDKPIYQPGETIRTRAFVRDSEFYSVLKQPAPGINIKAEVKTPSRFLLLRKQLVSNERGVVMLDFSLDEDAETGTYTLELTAENSTATYEIEVKRYEKPAFRVTISPDKEYVEPGKVLTGEIFAEYYFGKPVTNGIVKVNFYWGDESTPFGTYTGTTGSDGKIDFRQSVPTRSDDKYYYYYSGYVTVEATVEDPVGREVSSSTTVSTYPDLYIWGYISPWLPLPGDDLTVYFYSYQYSPQYLADKPVTIKVYGVNFWGMKSLLKTFTTTTNQYGSGSQTFSLSDSEIRRFTSFYVKIDLDTGDGRKGSHNFSFQYAVLGLDLSLPKNSYDRGETVQLTMSLVSLSSYLPSSVDVRLYVNDADYDSLYRADVTISGKKTVSLQLGDLAPHGKYRIHAYIRYRNEQYSYYYYYFSRSIVFEVSESQGTSGIQLSTEKTSYSSGETIQVEGEYAGITNAPLIVELTKRGVVSVQTFTSNEFTLEITGLERLYPRLFVFAYAFDERGSIYETYLVLEITREITVSITTDKDIYEPGETATVTIKLTDESGNPASGLAAISFIDSSVFGVKEDPETELDYFERQSYWSWMTTATNMKGEQPYWYYYWGEDIYFFYGSLGGFGYRNSWGLEEDVVFFGTPSPEADTQKGGGPPSAPKIDVKVRSNLPESMYWMPDMWIDGEDTYEIALPDNIGEWTVRIVLTYGLAGEGILEKATFKTQLPFFVEMTKPAVIKQDDVVVVKGVVYNYLATNVIVNVSITVDGFEILNLPHQKIHIPPDYLADVGWSLLATGSGSHNITIYAITSSQGEFYADAIQKTVWIEPNGVAYQEEYSGTINGSEELEITVYDTSVNTQAFLVLSSGFGDLALNSWQRLAGYPYGCVEQTISRIVPDALILSYLNKTGELTPETRVMLEDMLFSGLSRLYAFQHADGGWGWWYDDTSNPYMTAIVLQGFAHILEAGVYVDAGVIKAGIEFLASRQLSNGSWTTNAWHIDDYAFTAFTARTLQQLAVFSESTAAVSNALSYLTSTWSTDESVRNPYSAALILQGFHGTGKLLAGFETELSDYLLDNKKVESGGLYWTYDSSYYWRSLGGNVETTALALVSLYEYDRAANLLVVQDAINWVISKQKAWGWGSTADTAAAIWAVMTLASGENENIDATIDVIVNDGVIETVLFDSTTDPTAGLVSIRDYLLPGKNTVTLNMTGEGTITYYLRVNEQLRAKPIVNVDPLVNVYPGLEFQVNLTMERSSAELLVTDISVKSLAWEYGIIGSNWDYSVILLEPKSFVFTYQAPSIEGIYQLGGIQIEYLMRFTDGTKATDGLISEVHGPITINVTRLAANTVENAFFAGSARFKAASGAEFLSRQDLPAIKFNKTLSQTEGFKYGDTVEVRLDIHSLESETYNFLVIEDQVPSGFVLDESSLQTTDQVPSYKITSKGVSFFLPELDEGDKLTITYRVMATSILQSMVASAKLTQMYSDEWTVETERYVIGDIPVKYNPGTGLLVRDLDLPVIGKISYEQVDNKVEITVDATDNSGISRIRVYYGQEDEWNSAELERDSTTGEWKGLMGPFSSSNDIIAFIEVQDNNQNKIYSDIIQIIIELAISAIPVIAIVLLLGIAAGSGLTVSQLVRKKLLRDVK